MLEFLGLSPSKKSETEKVGNTLAHFSSISSLGNSSKMHRIDATPGKEPKRRKFAQDESNEDISNNTVAEIVAIIDNPNYITGPDVRSIYYFRNSDII